MRLDCRGSFNSTLAVFSIFFLPKNCVRTGAGFATFEIAYLPASIARIGENTQFEKKNGAEAPVFGGKYVGIGETGGLKDVSGQRVCGCIGPAPRVDFSVEVSDVPLHGTHAEE